MEFTSLKKLLGLLLQVNLMFQAAQLSLEDTRICTPIHENTHYTFVGSSECQLHV
jgi:hypothetical protein